MRLALYIEMCLGLRRPCLPKRWHKIEGHHQSIAGNFGLARTFRYRGQRYWLMRGYDNTTTMNRSKPRKSWCVSTTRPTYAVPGGSPHNSGELWYFTIPAALRAFRRPAK